MFIALSELHGSNSQVYYLQKVEPGHTAVSDTLRILCLPKRLALKIDSHKEGKMGELWQVAASGEDPMQVLEPQVSHVEITPLFIQQMFAGNHAGHGDCQDR